MSPSADFAGLFATPAPWLRGTGPHADMVLSTRIRLARNLKDVPFTHRAKDEQLLEVIARVHGAVKAAPSLTGGLLLKMQECSPIERQVLLERHLVSNELCDGARPRGIYVAQDDRVSVMINEEDHIRLQSLTPGFQLAEAWGLADAADDGLDAALEYAFSEDIGYLTACPTNAGTGLRASVLIHLPALMMTGGIQPVLKSITQVGLSIRGMYGEHSDTIGAMFQISNQTTLGRSENDSIESLERVTRQVIETEERARERMLRDARVETEDHVWRAYGLLRYCRAIQSKEVINLLSKVRLGVVMGLEGLCSLRVLNELMVQSQPAHLQQMAGREMNPDERKLYRAQVVRERLAAAERETGENRSS